MRKKIPTITRPDRSYAASLRKDGGDIPDSEKAGSVAPNIVPVAAAEAEAREQIRKGEPHETPAQPASVVETARPTAKLPPPAREPGSTRKIDIRVNALARQEAALLACGVDPAHVIRAALRRALKGWQLAPVHVAPSEERRTRVTGWQARTSLAIDAAHLLVLLRNHDPLDVLSKWALIRGQVEPRVWDEIDALLVKIAANAATRQEHGASKDIDQYR